MLTDLIKQLRIYEQLGHRAIVFNISALIFTRLYQVNANQLKILLSTRCQ